MVGYYALYVGCILLVVCGLFVSGGIVVNLLDRLGVFNRFYERMPMNFVEEDEEYYEQ